MGRPLRFLVTILVLTCSAFAVGHAQGAAALERGTAIIEPFALRELDHGRLGLGRIMRAAGSADAALANGGLFALPSMVPVREALDAEFDRYLVRHRADFPDESIGVGPYDVQLFDRALLYSDQTRFELSGIVNRMDRAYVEPESCGEIRLIYRLTRTGMPEPGEGAVSPRLPMTLNVVLKARADHAVDGNRCAEIARRWLRAGESAAVGAELAKQLIAGDGPLGLVRPENIERIETNLQIAHVPKTPRHDFRTDYLLKVFRYDAQAQRFDQAPLENQIDRERILADPELKREFSAWLLEPGNFSALDRGTILIPEQLLASRAIVATPVGFDPSKLQPAFGLVQGDDAAAEPAFSDHDVVAALKHAAERGVVLQNIHSVAGFERRLNDITCAGCHQTRGIGGFHFPGVDWMAAKPSNSTVVPGSPHFFGDQVRRRDILMALRDGRSPDYSRGFSSRPQLRGSTELAGTEYDNGWGAHCYRQMPDAKDSDLSFRSWTCASGLACQIVGARSRMGMCFIDTRERNGQPPPRRPD
jgi:hypothetical protein